MTAQPPLRINPKISRLVCSSSGRVVEPHGFTRPIGLCSCCPPPGRPVVIEYDLERIELGTFDRSAGIWSYADLLPVIGPDPSFAADVGGSPTIELPRLSRELGITVLVKNEGGNPSGSFKDRGLAVGVALGRACGAERFCLPTQGNAGVAASLFSARLGLPGCLVYMPEGYQDGLYHREARFFGAEVRFAGANIAAAGRQMRADVADELASGAYVDMSTFFEPGRLEGKKTMGLEIAEDLGPEGLPDWILYPTGGGTGLVGIWKALSELAALGRLDPAVRPLPRMVAVQSAACAPVVEAFDAGLEQVEPVESRGTVADGLDVPGAIMGHGILRTIRESRGAAVAVAEAEILEAFAECGRHGIAASFEAAAVVAALHRLRGEGVIADSERALLLLTAGHLIPLGKRAVPGWE
ncbi:MAG: threonine synthase [Thermoanaerobaculales bacterium]|jgi:threonine synthase|nr:threonine synthase [Thermoanaerobaculales bacterium]